jgi:hypothetical protein
VKNSCRAPSAAAPRFGMQELDSVGRIFCRPVAGWHWRESVVRLIVYYVAFMIAGDLAAYVIGLLTEREFGGQVSLIVPVVVSWTGL